MTASAVVRDHLIVAGVDDAGDTIHPETLERLLEVPAREAPSSGDRVPEAALQAARACRESEILDSVAQENDTWMEQEDSKLTAYGEDLERAFESERKAIEAEIKTAGKALRLSNLSMEDKLAERRRINAMEGRRDRMRLEHFQRRDDIRARLDTMLEEMQERLAARPEVTDLFTIRWVLAQLTVGDG